MRELIYKNRIFKEARKREICIEETVEQNGCISRTIKKSLYFIRGISPVKSQEEFQKWVKAKQVNGGTKTRKCHIMKIHSDKDKTDTVVCKAKGTFYIVSGKEIYNIVFLHSLRMEIAEQ